ncbi:hypothetical protein BVRB_5g115960 [Beta vulgaris subsp. vulgaris]|nr:hypothetical protein BVRB_5g115960 [Beta vulgaris subsp. vulgaris]
MEETEKMTALKKAYAEIILNTAKEAAGRIMASERKAHQFHHDLSSTKDEALRLLLRLKQTMDVKVNEAEMKSLNQQRRIEELEAQLQEAEDIVSNLRAELNEAHMKVEELANNQTNYAPNMTEKAHCEERTKQSENGLSRVVLDAQTNLLNQSENGHYVANNSVEELGNSGDPVVPSIIMRSKKPELYRNGCTQRVRAYEGNVVNDHFSLSGELDELKYEKSTRDKRGEGISMTLVGADATSKPFDIENEDNVDKISNPLPLKSFRKRRKRAARYRRSNTSTLKPIPLMAKEAVSDLPNTQTCVPGSHDLPESSEIKGKCTHTNPPSTAPSSVSELGVLSALVTPQGDETEARMVAVNEDTEVASSLVLIRQQSGSGDCLDVSSSKQDLETNNSSSVYPDSKVLDAGGISSPPLKDRVLKYTFQRKRKKESVSGDDSSLLEENPLKRKMVKKQNGNLEAPKSGTVTESSRDSRRMAQVARQLISLSEKKWWK